jgi:hypothetical protein
MGRKWPFSVERRTPLVQDMRTLCYSHVRAMHRPGAGQGAWYSEALWAGGHLSAPMEVRPAAHVHTNS